MKTMLKRSCEWGVTSTVTGKDWVCGKPATEKINDMWMCREHAEIWHALEAFFAATSPSELVRGRVVT